MKTSESIDALSKALAAAQGEMKNATLNRVNPHFKNRYADLAAIRDAVVPAMSKHGLAVTQTTDITDGGFFLTTRVAHESGQWMESVYPLAVNPNPQAMGSQLTYARRYSLSAIAGISADEDDDAEIATSQKNGNGAVMGKSGTVSPAQVSELQKLVMDTNADLPRLLKYLKVERLDDVPAVQFDAVVMKLNAKAAQADKAA